MDDYQAILNHVPPLLLVVFRIGGLMAYGPIFGSTVIPTRVKAMLAVLVGLAVYPLLSATVIGGPLELGLWGLLPIIALEMLIGFTIGFVASLPLLSVQMGGLMIGQQMGLGFARFYNPAVDDEADVLGQLLFFVAVAGFLVIGGHEAMLYGVLRTFEHLPLGGMVFGLGIIDVICGLLLSACEISLRVAAPVLAIVFLQSVAMGFLAKTVPQLNILSLGFPLRILIGFFIVGAGLVIIDEVVMVGIDEGLQALFNWIEMPRG